MDNCVMISARISFSMLLFVIVLPALVRGGDHIRLDDIKVLTLYTDRMTNARRSSAVPQLKCVGGTAGCHAFKPQVVQCYNRGSDGFDAQWECKTDMDNAYRFGTIEVTCEGYKHSDDPNVLKGSCGLEYTLDLTKEGHSSHQHNYYGNQNHGQKSYYKSKEYDYKKHSSGFGEIILLVAVGLIIYAIYKTCLSSSLNQHQYSTTDSDYPTDDSHNYPHYNTGGGGFFGNMFGGGGSAPPSYGFRQEHYDAGCSSRRPNAGSNSGGFWTGAATGGLLGYMFGNRNTRSSSYHASPGWSNDSGGWFGGSSSTSGGSSSSGTRTASGFGGTRRR